MFLKIQHPIEIFGLAYSTVETTHPYQNGEMVKSVKVPGAMAMVIDSSFVFKLSPIFRLELSEFIIHDFGTFYSIAFRILFLKRKLVKFDIRCTSLSASDSSVFLVFLKIC